MEKEIVYVASPNWELNLYTSIHSLVQSGNQFSRIRVFSVGGKMKRIKSISENIKVDVVKNRDKIYFGNNKTYMTESNAEKVTYLDADTLVLGNINKVRKAYEKNIIARKDDSSYAANAIKDKSKKYKKSWNNILEGRYNEAKMYNTGFLIFKNGSNKSIEGTWKNLSKKDKKFWDKKSEKKNEGRRITEQMTFSISVKREKIEVGEMKNNHHVYGWWKKPEEIEENTIVYHTGSRGGRHLKYASCVSKKCNVDFSIPVISRATHPLFLKLQGSNFGYRIKHFFTGENNN